MRIWQFMLILAIFAAARTVFSNDATEETPAFSIRRGPVLSETNDYNNMTCHEWNNILVIPELNLSVSLSPSEACYDSSNNLFCSGGLEKDSIKLSWLDSGRLLWLSWETTPSGSGLWIVEGNVVIQISESGTKELFRDFFLAIVQNGCYGGMCDHLSIQYDKALSIIIFTRLKDRTEWEYKQEFLSELENEYQKTYNDDESHVCQQEWKVKRSWGYKLTDDGLLFAGGSQWVDLGKQTFKIKHEVCVTFNIDLEGIIALNPNLSSTSMCSGIITLSQTIEPYPYQTFEYADDLSGETTNEAVKEFPEFHKQEVAFHYACACLKNSPYFVKLKNSIENPMMWMLDNPYEDGDTTINLGVFESCLDFYHRMKCLEISLDGKVYEQDILTDELTLVYDSGKIFNPDK